jgi:hypothetical protein
VLLIDDLRIFEIGPYAGGNVPDQMLDPQDTLAFLAEAFGGTHAIQRDYADQGYLALSPL